MSIDMNPATTPANTPTSIGTTEICAVINENDILDADESAVDALSLDVVVGPLGVPGSNPMIFYAYTLEYSAANIRVADQDQNFLLHEAGGAFVSVSDLTPDSDGEFNAGELDLDFAAAETGPGVLNRVTIESLDTATPGVYTLTLTDAATSDPSMDAFPPDALADAVLVIGPLPTPNPCGDDDGDDLINALDNCPSVPTVWIVPFGDDDCDGWTTADENVIGTNPNDNCGGDLTWPPNIFNAPPSADTVDIFDLATMAPPVFFSTPGPGSPYSVRLDLTAGSAPGDPIIDIFDVATMAPPIFFATCTP